MDSFSKFLWLLPSKNNSAHEFCAQFKKKFKHLKPCQVLMSDKGTQFNCRYTKDFLQKEYDIRLKIKSGGFYSVSI